MAKPKLPTAYGDVHTGIVELLESARRAAARSVNALMTASYWEIGRRIVEFEQGGKGRAKYGQQLLKSLSADLTARFGRGFGVINLQQMRNFYLFWPQEQIYQTPSDKSLPTEILQTPSAKSSPHPIRQTPSGQLPNLATLATRFPLPWSAYVRLLSVKSEAARAFYETEALRCLTIIDLKAGRFSYADAGQMHLYLNYAREHWMKPGENPPVGLILCADKGAAEAHYALDNLPSKVLAAEYRTLLPDEKLIAEELERSRRELEARQLTKPKTAGEA
jgi:hypothetical protein